MPNSTKTINVSRSSGFGKRSGASQGRTDLCTLRKMCQTTSPQYQDFTEHNKFVICIKHELGKHGFLELLVDTGATCSMVKIDHINQNAYLDPADKLSIGGAFGGEESTFGSIQTYLNFGEDFIKKCKFHVIQNTESIPADGILGADFLQNNCIMDCIDHIMYCCDENQRTLVKISNTFGKNKPTLEDIAPWEKYSRGIGQKILFEQGYTLGAGLGENEQGMSIPMAAKANQNTRHGLGYTQPQPNTEHQDLYGQHSAELRQIESDPILVRTRKNYFEYPESDYSITLQPRTESVVAIRIKEKGKRFCPATQVQDGVFTSNTIIKSVNGYANIAIINSQNKELTIHNFYPQTQPMHQYEEIESSPKNSISENIRKLRYEKLIQIIDRRDLPAIENEEISRILLEFHDIFHLPGDNLTFTNVKKFKLPLLNDAEIVNKKQYRLPEKHREEIQKQINSLQENDIIEPSISPFNSPVILVPKKGTDPEGNKLFRMCVDFRELNKVSIPYSFPLPRIEDILDQLGGSAYFSTLDLSQGFHQVLIHEEDKEKTAFSSNFGHYQYKRCPFGLKTLPGFFQSLLNGILSGLQGVKCFVYIDDVVIFSPTLQEHTARIIEVFERFRDSNIKLNPTKCKFLKKEVTYLGHKCTIEGVQPDQRLVEAIQLFPVPTTIKQLQSFLGLANYYRQFIENYARIASPLYGLLRGAISENRKQIKKWNPECDAAFNSLKTALITEPVLTYPDFNKDFTINCDASLKGLGAVLEQGKKVIAYASRALLDTEKKWSATELELNAVVFSWQTFKPYVLGRHIKVYSDHMPLKGVLKMKDTASRIVRLQQKLLDFDYEIIYKKGKENSCADFLSRNPLLEQCNKLSMNDRSSSIKPITAKHNIPEDSDDEFLLASENITDGPEQCAKSTPVPCLAVTRRQAQLAAETNPAPHTSSLTTTPTPTESEPEQPLDQHQATHNKTYPTDNEDWEEVEDFQEDSQPITLITEPKDMKTILKDYHDSVFGGHFGVAKTYGRIRNQFYWKGMKRYITNYIAKCGKCQRNKAGRATRMKLCNTDLSDRPFDKIYIDIVGPLPMSASGNKYILSMIDDLTRFVEFTAIPDQTANTVARALFEEILCRYTLPRVIISDCGTNFLSDTFKEMCRLLGIDKRQLSPFSPQGNLVERQHSTLANYLRCFAESDPTTWDTYLRTAAHAYNNTAHVSTGYSPMQLLFGFTSAIPLNLKRKPIPLYNHDKYFHELRYKLQTSFNNAREKLAAAKLKSKEFYDRHINPRQFTLGKFVFMKNTKRNSKFSPHWVGPWEIVRTNGLLNVTLKIGRKLRKVHVNRLKPTILLK